MNDRTLTELTEIVKKSFSNYDKQGTGHWSWETAAQDLTYQIGSLTKIRLQLNNQRWADGKSKEQLMAELEDELADIMAEVLYIASELKIDMNTALDKMVESDTQKVRQRTI